jgi:hypothetical protein
MTPEIFQGPADKLKARVDELLVLGERPLVIPTSQNGVYLIIEDTSSGGGGGGGGATDFLDLTDTPNSYSGQSNKLLGVNVGANGIEYKTADKSLVGLSNVDNTSDANKPVSSATQTALNGKQDILNTFDKAILYQASATSGDIQGIPDWQVNTQGGLTQTMSQTTNNGGLKDINTHNANLIHAVNSPNEGYK